MKQVEAILLAAAAALFVVASAAESSWIMANTRMPVPTCPAHCLAAKQDDGEDNVGFSACKSMASAGQEWSYDAASGAIKQQRSGGCLGYTPDRVLEIVACEPNEQAQQWTVDVGAAAISVRLATTTMYLAMASSGSLWREAMLVEPGNGTGNRIVSLVPFGSAFSSSSSMVAARSSSAGNLVVNGGFELSSYDVGAPVELAPGDTFGSCGWEIVHGQAELVSAGRYDPGQQLSMHLWANTTLTQRFEANTGGYYVLSFLLGAPRTVACDGQLLVRVAPSSLADEIIVKPVRSDYWTTKAYAFQAAAASSINLSFRSWLCEVLIDDVRVVPLTVDVRVLPLTVATSTPPPVKRLSSVAMAAVIAGASVAAFLAGCLCAAVTIFRLLRPVPASETSDCVSSVNQQQLERLQDLKRLPTFAGVRILSFAQIDKATHSFSTVLGKGSLGYVYFTEFDDGTRGATKRIFKMFQLIEMDFFDTVKRLGRIVHPNIVKLIAFSRDHGEQILVFEYVPGVNLYQRLHGSRQPCFPWNSRIGVALDVAVVLEFLHHVASPRIVHGRVKSSNVFITKEGKAKLGHCAFVSHPRAEADGYMDPAGDSADKGDVYSFGILLLEVVSGRQPPFGGQSRELEVDQRLLALEGGHQLKGLDQIARMASACLHDEPEERPSMSEVVELLRQCAVLDSQAETTPETRSRPNSPA